MEPRGERPQLKSVRTAVVGASGYIGQELLHYLARHPAFDLKVVVAKSTAGKKLSELVHGLPKELAELTILDSGADFGFADQADLFFLAVPHGTAVPYAVALREAGKTVVDLSADFRTDSAAYREFYDHDHPAPSLLKEAIYGLPEIHRSELKAAKLIASPGCYPTSIIMPLAPFLRTGLIDPDTIVVNSLSGVSGAGRKVELRLTFGEINENMYAYSVPKHRHLGEIEQELALAAGKKVTITFTPHLVPLHRGMLSTTTAKLLKPMTDAEVHAVLEEAYGQEPFVEVLTAPALPEVRQVANSNCIQIAAQIDPRTNRLLIFSAIDNLGKGAASQAIQAANLACGLEETTGLL
jgi:N-acetyl-gamma-glutamyl-phosphate reductase